MHGSRRGFTLIELMIVVVIVAILASIAWPSYQAYIQRSRRSDAQSLMLAISSKEQQYMLDRRQFTDLVGPTGLNMNQQGWTCTVNGNKVCVNAYYSVSVEVLAGPPPGFNVIGAPGGVQADDGTLNYSSTGAKTRMVSGTDKGW
jgi:type IV pilus assembly protein PilE